MMFRGMEMTSHKILISSSNILGDGLWDKVAQFDY
jgi:hypothetical protein